MNLNDLLREKEASIVDEATRSLERSVLPHYQQAGLEVGRKRLMELYRLVRAGIADRDLAPVVDYMAQVADERYHAGYAIREVQIAINVLEEAMWDYIVQDTPPDELAEALGLASTALGAAKDSLARTYVSLAGHIKAPSLDLSALFEGYTGG